MSIEDDIIVVDDEITNLRLLTELLEKAGYHVRPAEKAQTAIDAALSKPPGLILLDVRMPEIDGFEVCRRLKQDERTRHIPIIFLSVLDDIEAKVKGFEAGGADFITTPFKELEILVKVKTHMSLLQIQRRLDQLVDKRTSELSQIKASLEQKVRELKESDERYKLAIAGSVAGIWDWDIGSDKMYYSDQLIKLLGNAPGELSESPEEFWNRLHPDDYEAVRLAFIQHLKERVVFRTEYRLKTKSGEYRWFHSRGQALWDKTGQAIRMSGALADITDRKLAEEKLMISEEHFRKLLEQSPLAIELLTPEGKIKQVNKAWMQLWGVNEEEASELLANYNMLTDPQVKNLGIAPLVESAFAGENVVLPPIEYHGSRAADEMSLPHIKAKSVWIECHLYSVRESSENISQVVNIYLDITERMQAEIELRDAFKEIEKLNDRLEAEKAYLQDEIKLEHNFKNIIGQSESLKYVLNRVEQVASMDTPVLVMGETGTGKELVARAIHELSPHGKRALVKVNCATLPSELIESELFGREKGAFTGATTTRSGRFELAKGSTLLLDEIGELPLELQAKLLRVLESGEFERLGSSHTLHSDARIIAATNRVLDEEVRQGRFREDLWYRLKVFPITVPPLRDRTEDIPLLVDHFVQIFSRKMGKSDAKISKHIMRKLQRYHWPGNVRELKHAVESALITAKGKKLNFELPQIDDAALSDFKSFEEMERDYILQVLKAKNWKVGGENSAASILGMHVNTLRGRMKKLGIKKPKLQ